MKLGGLLPTPRACEYQEYSGRSEELKELRPHEYSKAMSQITIAEQAHILKRNCYE